MIKEGEYFVISTGAYSDYTIITLCKALTDLNVTQLQQEYCKRFPNNCKEYEFSSYHFAKWLIVDKQVAEELFYKELYTGSYDTISLQVWETDKDED